VLWRLLRRGVEVEIEVDVEVVGADCFSLASSSILLVPSDGDIAVVVFVSSTKFTRMLAEDALAVGLEAPFDGHSVFVQSITSLPSSSSSLSFA
jgi:hypothetical protein